jgi:hypothetical protein
LKGCNLNKGTDQPGPSRRMPVLAPPKSSRDVVSYNPKTGEFKLSTPCAFCSDDGHWASDCTRYQSWIQRVTRLERGTWKGCRRCLKAGHDDMDCWSIRKCYHCTSQYHHRALCPVKYPHQAGEPIYADNQTDIPRGSSQRDGGIRHEALIPERCRQHAALATTMGHCHRCLLPGHVAKVCREDRPCFYCGAATHHYRVW